MYLDNIHCLIPIIIPAYEPGMEFAAFINSLSDCGKKTIIVVDDGSGIKYRPIFDSIEKCENVIVLRHAVNLGKGRSLKDAFNFALDQYPDLVGVVTADSDGQHSIKDINRVLEKLLENPENLILGCREFKKDDIPWKSKLGNQLTRKFCSFLCGVKVSDTQTGLRGIPAGFMKILLVTPGERFEYETNMLLECNNGIVISEVPIQTIYESKENHKTHFNPLRDSLTIYKVILSYSLSSILATVIDFGIFTTAIKLGYSVWYSTAVGRILAAFTNFMLNRNIVFRSKENGERQFVEYAALVIVSGLVSALTINYLHGILSINIVVLKAMVEVALFFFNYYIQRSYIFAQRKGSEIGKSLFSDEIKERTDWTSYYQKRKSRISTYTQKYTLKRIIEAIESYMKKESGELTVCELGGGNSCFAAQICKRERIKRYDIVDSNKFAVRLFEDMEIETEKHHAILQDLLEEKSEINASYDFVYSIGLIEHFRGKDIETVIRRHFEYCKNGGIVFVSFPTPTAKYIFIRTCMEMLGVWQFYDEKPIRHNEISGIFDKYGKVLDNYVNKKLPLTQEVVIIRKGGDSLCQ